MRALYIFNHKEELEVINRTSMACLAALALASEADALTFTNTQFDVTAIAVTSGPVGLSSQSSPPSATPVVASADSIGGTDVATAGAIGGPGLLTTSADVSGGGGIASAVGTSHFSGSFLTTILEPALKIDFSPLNFAVGSATAATSLFVSLTSGGRTLFQDLVSGSFSYNLGPGTTALLDLTLTSEVSAGFPGAGSGNASSAGLVSITGAIPEASTWLLFALGLGALAAVRSAGRRNAD